MSNLGVGELEVGSIPEVKADAISENFNPLLVLCNAKSGGGQGVEIFSRLSSQLNRLQVYDITQLGPHQG